MVDSGETVYYDVDKSTYGRHTCTYEVLFLYLIDLPAIFLSLGWETVFSIPLGQTYYILYQYILYRPKKLNLYPTFNNVEESIVYIHLWISKCPININNDKIKITTSFYIIITNCWIFFLIERFSKISIINIVSLTQFF